MHGFVFAHAYNNYVERIAFAWYGRTQKQLTN